MGSINDTKDTVNPITNPVVSSFSAPATPQTPPNKRLRRSLQYSYGE
jgi:hypothetical protein